MKTFILLTFMPVRTGLLVPTDVLRLADDNGFRVTDGVEKGERYIRFESCRRGNDLNIHLAAVVAPVVTIATVLRETEQAPPVELGCVVYGDAQNGVNFSKEELRLMVNLDMSLDIQAYDIGGDDEEEDDG